MSTLPDIKAIATAAEWLSLERDTGAFFTLVLETDGGRFACKKLEQQVLSVRANRPEAVAIIKIGTTEFAAAVRPEFEIQNWAPQSANAGAPGDHAIASTRPRSSGV
jgi:hypothetical protein